MESVKTEKWAWVTGASSGIGRQLALQAAEAGYHTVLTARRIAKLEQVKKEITERSGGEVKILPADLSTPTGIQTLEQALRTLEIPVHLFFNNAGFGTNGTFCDLDLGNQLSMIDLNCRALVHLSYLVANQMKKQGEGTIVHTASMGGMSPTPYYAVYGATKAFVISFSEALAEEMKSHNVKVKVLCPGATDTEFSAVSNFSATTPRQNAVQSSEAVARETLRQLASPVARIVPGFGNRVAAKALHWLPRSWAIRAAANALRPVPLQSH